jgi:hypothetical protein
MSADVVVFACLVEVLIGWPLCTLVIHSLRPSAQEGRKIGARKRAE